MIDTQEPEPSASSGSAGSTSSKGGGGLSGGAIAGIVVGVLFGLALAALLALYIARRRSFMLPVSLPSGVKRNESTQGMLHADLPPPPNAVSTFNSHQAYRTYEHASIGRTLLLGSNESLLLQSAELALEILLPDFVDIYWLCKFSGLVLSSKHRNTRISIYTSKVLVTQLKSSTSHW